MKTFRIKFTTKTQTVKGSVSGYDSRTIKADSEKEAKDEMKRWLNGKGRVVSITEKV